jgi:hypothetical protein
MARPVSGSLKEQLPFGNRPDAEVPWNSGLQKFMGAVGIRSSNSSLNKVAA